MRPLTLSLVLVLVGCSSSDKGLSRDASATNSAPSDPSGGGATGTATGAGTTLPPEVEDDFLALPPAQTDAYVFVANPTRNTVTRIHVNTLEVRTTSVGTDPQIALTTPDFTTAIVFNRGEDSVSILDAETLDQQVVGVRDDMNQMKLSPDGAFAVLWHDIAAEQDDDPPAEGLVSFSEASFVELATGLHSAMAVGFDPKDVVFTPDGTLAAIVSDGQLALIDLTAQVLLPELVQLSSELEPPPAEEVVLAPDGTWGFVRQFGTDEVLVVDLLNKTVDAIPVGLNPTDLDLSPMGDKAVVVARGSDQLWVLDTADPFLTPEVHPLPAGLGLGSLLFDPSGQQAMVYTTASLVDRMAIWDIVGGAVWELGLEKPVSGMGVSPTGDSLLVFHTVADAIGADPSSPFFNEHALTLLDLTDFRANPLLLPAEPNGYALSQSGDVGYFTMEGERYLEKLDFNTLLHDQIELKSDPVFLGVLPDLDPLDGVEPMAWVSQDHDLGRISFYDDNDAALETITGFELNAGVE